MRCLFNSTSRQICLVMKFVRRSDHVVVFSSLLPSRNCSPFNNPMETYRYYTLPYCQEHTTELDSEDEAEEESRNMAAVKGDRKGGARFKQRLGETVAGDHKETSPYEITYLDQVRRYISRSISWFIQRKQIIPLTVCL
jgi:hypothetical protein